MNKPRQCDRGQLVLVAAVFIAIAFVPITAAYLQLGYAADIGADENTASDALATTTRLLEGAVHRARPNVTIHDRLRPQITAIERAPHSGAQHIRYNQTAATAWAATNCPNCTADRGVVQQRNGAPHVLAVVFDVEITTDQERIEATVIVRPIRYASSTIPPNASRPTANSVN